MMKSVKKEKFEQLENEVKSLLLTIRSIKDYQITEEEADEMCTIDGFYKNYGGLLLFIKSMRVKGFFGKSPQNLEDLDMQYDISMKLEEIKAFVEKCYEKYKPFDKSKNS